MVNHHRGAVEIIGDLLLEIKRNPQYSTTLILARTNLNHRRLKAIEKLGFVTRVKSLSGRQVNLQLTEKGQNFLIHYGKLIKILITAS